MYNDMTSHTISNAYMKFEMSVNEHVVMSYDQRSSLCHPTNLLLLLIIQIFQEHQLNSRTFPAFPGGISNSRRFPVVPGDVDILVNFAYQYAIFRTSTKNMIWLLKYSNGCKHVI